MFSRSRISLIALILALLVVAGACGSSDSDADLAGESATNSPDDVAADEEEIVGNGSDPDAPVEGQATAATESVDANLFFDGALASEVATENCTLSGGAETMCYRITAAGDPVTYETGPFCPSTINDDANAGGIWFDGNGVYDLDGEFISGLADLYDDDNWQMYDSDGNVLITETAEEFDLAARPDVDPSLQNHCVEGRLEWLENGQPITTTALIPINPVMADAPTSPQGNLGITLDGVVIAPSAPVDAILGAYTIAAFDDCGGHYNPNDGYHMHGAVGCSELDEVSEGETPMFAYAMDGFPVHSAYGDSEPADLDECNGHETEEHGYHYHANGAERNLVLECLVGQTVATDSDDRGGRPDGPRPDGPGPEDG